MKPELKGDDDLLQGNPRFMRAISNDIPLIVGFHNRMNKLNRTIDDWKWEYGRPSRSEGIYTVIKIDDDILGTQAVIPIDLVIEGSTILSGKSESSLLDPRLRGKGLFEKLYAYNLALCTDEGIQIVWGMTSAVRKWRDGLGFVVNEGKILEASLILRPLHLIMNHLISSKRLTSRLYQSYKDLTSYLRQGRIENKIKGLDSHSNRIERQLTSDDDINNLLKKMANRKEFSVSIDMNKEYLNWRVWTNPNLRYECHFHYQDDDLVGYCLASRANGDLYIADMIALDDDSGAYLLDHLLKLWRQERITAIKFMGNSSNTSVSRIFSLLKDRGFIVHKTEIAFVRKNLGNITAPDFKDWLVTGLWTEGFKI
jgi:hypothetical protein